MKLCASLILLCLLCASCERDESSQSPATTAPAPVSYRLELKPLTPLLPNRLTHVVIDTLGNIFWVQESDRGDDTLFVIGEGEIPRATSLSSAAIAAAMGVPGGTGNIHSVAAGPGGNLYFYFTGGNKRKFLACFGRYSPNTSTIRILCDTDSLMTATAMGRSLSLARGTVIAQGRTLWLWVRHSDAWVVFALDASRINETSPVTLVRAFENVKLGGKNVSLSNDDYELSAGPEESLYWLDLPGSAVRRIDKTGVAVNVRSLVGLPPPLSLPVNDRQGRLVLFAADDPKHVLEAHSEDQAANKFKLIIAFPALLMFDGETLTTVGREDILAYAGFPIYGMRLKQLVPHPSEDMWVSYNVSSGELLSLRLQQKMVP